MLEDNITENVILKEILGSATAVFNNCEIFSKSKNFHMNGYVFIDRKLTSNSKANSVYLGRPWRDYAKTAFIKCYMGEHIRK